MQVFVWFKRHTSYTVLKYYFLTDVGGGQGLMIFKIFLLLLCKFRFFFFLVLIFRFYQKLLKMYAQVALAKL